MVGGYEERTEVRIKPGPDGRPVRRVYTVRRDLSLEEAGRLLAEQEGLSSKFESCFRPFYGLFAEVDRVFRDARDHMGSGRRRGV